MVNSDNDHDDAPAVLTAAQREALEAIGVDPDQSPEKIVAAVEQVTDITYEIIGNEIIAAITEENPEMGVELQNQLDQNAETVEIFQTRIDALEDLGIEVAPMEYFQNWEEFSQVDSELFAKVIGDDYVELTDPESVLAAFESPDDFEQYLSDVRAAAMAAYQNGELDGSDRQAIEAATADMYQSYQYFQDMNEQATEARQLEAAQKQIEIAQSVLESQSFEADYPRDLTTSSVLYPFVAEASQTVALYADRTDLNEVEQAHLDSAESFLAVHQDGLFGLEAAQDELRDLSRELRSLEPREGIEYTDENLAARAERTAEIEAEMLEQQAIIDAYQGGEHLDEAIIARENFVAANEALLNSHGVDHTPYAEMSEAAIYESILEDQGFTVDEVGDLAEGAAILSLRVLNSLSGDSSAEELNYAAALIIEDAGDFSSAISPVYENTEPYYVIPSEITHALDEAGDAVSFLGRHLDAVNAQEEIAAHEAAVTARDAGEEFDESAILSEDGLALQTAQLNGLLSEEQIEFHIQQYNESASVLADYEPSTTETYDNRPIQQNDGSNEPVADTPGEPVYTSPGGPGDFSPEEVQVPGLGVPTVEPVEVAVEPTLSELLIQNDAMANRLSHAYTSGADEQSVREALENSIAANQALSDFHLANGEGEDPNWVDENANTVAELQEQLDGMPPVSADVQTVDASFQTDEVITGAVNLNNNFNDSSLASEELAYYNPNNDPENQGFEISISDEQVAMYRDHHIDMTAGFNSSGGVVGDPHVAATHSFAELVGNINGIGLDGHNLAGSFGASMGAGHVLGETPTVQIGVPSAPVGDVNDVSPALETLTS